jgi:predicted aspartyl protease
MRRFKLCPALWRLGTFADSLLALIFIRTRKDAPLMGNSKQKTATPRVLVLSIMLAQMIGVFSGAVFAADQAVITSVGASSEKEQPPALDASSKTVAAAAEPQSAVSNEAARRLANQMVDAVGGMAKVREIYDAPTRSQGKITDLSAISGAANTFDAEVLSVRDKLRITVTIMGQPTVTGYNGSTSWMQQGDQVFPSDPITTQRIAEDARHGTQLILKFQDPDIVMETVPDKLIEGKLCVGLKVMADDGKPTTFYADKDTHLILRSEYDGLDFEQGVPALKSVDYYDYRPLLGSLVSYKSIEYTADKKTSESVISSIEVDQSINDSVFEMPAAIKIAGLENGPVSLPFEYIANEIVVKAKVNGGEEYRFLIDTGATQNVMDQAVAASLGPVTKSDLTLTTGAGFVHMGYIELNSVELGGLKLKNVPMAVNDMPAFVQIHPRPAGILGANVLRRFLVTIDYDERRVIFADPASVKVPSGATVVEAQPAFGAAGLSVEAKLDDRLKLTFLVDTGAAFNSVPENLIKTVLTVPLLTVGNVQGVEGSKITIGSVQLKTVTLGEITVNEPIFSVAPAVANQKLAPGLFSGSALGIMGNPFWSQFRLTIDYRNGRLILQKSKANPVAEVLSADLKRADGRLIKDRNYDAAIIEFVRIGAIAQRENIQELAAQVAASKSWAYFQRAAASEKETDAQAAMEQFNSSFSLTKEGKYKEIAAKLVAEKAIYLLNTQKTPSDLLLARKLLQEASSYSEAQPEVLVGVSILFERIGDLAMSQKMVDQALLSAPSNWQALSQRYDLARKQGKTVDLTAITALIKHYWPGVALPSETGLSKPTAIKQTTSSKISAPPQKKAEDAATRETRAMR